MHKVGAAQAIHWLGIFLGGSLYITFVNLETESDRPRPVVSVRKVLVNNNLHNKKGHPSPIYILNGMILISA